MPSTSYTPYPAPVRKAWHAASAAARPTESPTPAVQLGKLKGHKRFGVTMKVPAYKSTILSKPPNHGQHLKHKLSFCLQCEAVAVGIQKARHDEVGPQTGPAKRVVILSRCLVDDEQRLVSVDISPRSLSR